MLKAVARWKEKRRRLGVGDAMNSPESATAVDLLIVAAYAPEFSGLRRILGESLYANVSGVVVGCKPVGVGLPNATAGMVQRLTRYRPRAVVLVGTAGVYPTSPFATGEAVIAQRVHLVAPIEIEKRGAMPDPMSRTIDCHEMITRGLSQGRLPTIDVANTLVATTDDALALTLGAATGCGLENLECFGVANACALQSIPFACVLGISHRVSSLGREEWRANHRSSAQASCEVIARWLGAGATGLPHG
ncbi:MAG: hypothetical protein NVS3B20_09780 [Polyangiales bacterium]